jgi:hypothetical protein
MNGSPIRWNGAETFYTSTVGPRSVVTRPDDPIKGRNKVVAWIFLIRPKFVEQTSVTAVRDEPGRTKLTVEATKPEHAETLAAWIQKELIENKAAARAEAP